MTIGIWGDSITYGAGDAEALGWVGRLRRELALSKSLVYNLGLCGDTTTDVLKRFEVESEAIEPTMVVLAIGLNDSKFSNEGSGNKVPFDRFRDNMNLLVSQAKAAAEKVILIGLTEVNEPAIERRAVFKNETIRKYDDSLRELADRENVEYINMRGVLDIQFDLEDGLHPNAIGYEKMFREILPFIK